MLDHVRSTGNGHFDVFRHDLGIFPSLSISTWKHNHHCARLGHGPATDRAWSPVLGGFMQKHPNTVMWCNANIYCHTLYHLIMSTIWWVLYLQKQKHVILTDLCKYSLKHHNRKAFPMWKSFVITLNFWLVFFKSVDGRVGNALFNVNVVPITVQWIDSMTWTSRIKISVLDIQFDWWILVVLSHIVLGLPGWTFRNI